MKEKIFSILLLLWFFINMGLAWYGSKGQDTMYLTFLAIGQIMFVFGIIFVYQIIFKSKNNRIEAIKYSVLALVPLVGLGFICFGLNDIINLNIIQYAPVFVLSIFPLFGLLMIISSIIPYFHYEKYCTYEILAEVVKVKTRLSQVKVNGQNKKRIHYCPVYKIFYKGKNLQLCNNEYSKTKFEKDEKQLIKINPDNPQEFITEDTKRSCILSCILGCIFLTTIFFSYHIYLDLI